MSRFFLHISIINDNKLIQIGNQTQTTALKPDTPGGSPVHRTFHPRLQSSSMTDIEVGEPEFFTPTVSLGNTSYTSYDKYAATNGITQCINGDTNVGTTMGANNCQPETLYSPSAVIGGISENLIKNSNYVKKISFLVDGDGDSKRSYENGAMTSNSQTGADFTSLSWGSHTLTATFEFDGKSVTSASKTHHITGLPYTAAPPTNSGNHPWAGSANKWNDEYVRLHNNTITQTFHIPGDINVSVNHKARQYTRADDCTYTFKVGATVHYTKDQYSLGGTATNIDETYNDAQLKTSSPTIEATNSYGTIDAGFEYTNVRIYSIIVNYR